MSFKESQPSQTVGGVNKTPTPTTASPQQWFITEIQQMMHGLGDCRHPLHESAVLVEELTQHQMMMLLCKASDIAAMRGVKMIGVEDILFLLRKNKVKLRRLLKFLQLKDLKTSVVRGSVAEDDDQEHDVKAVPMKKRRKMCYDFLASIDQTGELLELFDDEEEDDVKYERLLRAELRSRCLDPQQYMEFCEARQANFGKRYKSQRFKDWLMTGLNLELKPSIHALEVISYLAYETVAQIVDLSLLVKQDQSLAASDPLSHTMQSVNHNLNESATLAAMMGSNTPQKFQGIASPTVSPPSTPSMSGQLTPTTPSSTTGQQLQGVSVKAKSKKRESLVEPRAWRPPSIKPSSYRIYTRQ